MYLIVLHIPGININFSSMGIYDSCLKKKPNYPLLGLGYVGLPIALGLCQENFGDRF